jgi:cold shock CspA family protein
MNENKVITGRIIKVSKSGWGFISSREIEFTKIFFHWTSLTQSTVPFLELKIGMIVEFTPVKIPDKGYRAIHIRVLEKKEDNETTNMPILQEQRPDTD